MTNTAEIVKQLNQFTKEEIIEALCSRNGSVQNIISECHDIRLRKETQDVEAASAAWKHASQEHIDYINKIKVEYKGVNLFDLPAEVRNKIIELQRNEERLYKELVNKQDAIDNHYKKLIKPR